MKGIKEFLERYRNALRKGDGAREDITAHIRSITGVDLKNSEFTINRGTIALHTSPIKKNQIFLYKEKIINTLKQNGINSIGDIR